MRNKLGGSVPPNSFRAPKLLLPTTAVPHFVGIAGVAGASFAWWLLQQWPVPPLIAIVLLFAACAAPMWWLEARRHASSAAAPATESIPEVSTLRLERLVALLAVTTFFLASISVQWLLAKDSVAGLYAWTLPALPVVGIWAAWHLLRPNGVRSSVDELGFALMRLWQHRRWLQSDLQVLLAWAVKAFFLPLMLAWSYTWFMQATDTQFLDSSGWMPWFTGGIAWLYAIDTAFGTIGYMSTSRRIGAEIRSVDATWLGWLSALVCYPPLSLVVLRQWLEYKDGFEWDAWLFDAPALKAAWAIAIILLTAIYTWSTVVFGPRFSNLTHRGIITSGPYKYSKHPAYICKNLSWWLISVPFVASAGTTTAAVNCLALLGVNGIYWLRAKTEERHLMNDPEYKQYAAWIARNGILGFGRRLFLRTAR